MATLLDPATSSAPSWSNDLDGPSNDADHRPFPTHLPDALVTQGWTVEDYFGHPAACHPAFGVVSLADDGFLACPRNGRPHAGFEDLLSACEHCVSAQPADPEAPCPLAGLFSEFLSGPSLLAVGAVTLIALSLSAWANHGWPF